MDWDSDEADAMLANTTVDISELSFSSSEDEHCMDLPPWCKPLLPSSSNPSTQKPPNTPTSQPQRENETENGVLSFENPNYTLGNTLDDALNSNTNNTVSITAPNNTSNDVQLDGGLAALDSLYTELDHVCNLTRTSSVRNRRHYAQLDIGSMGVDVTKGPVTNLDQADHQNNSLVENEGMMGRKKGSFTTQPDIIEHASPQRYNNQPQQPQQLNNQQINNNQEPKSNQNEKDPDKAMVTPEGVESAEEGVQGDSSTSSAASKSPYKERSQDSPLNEGHIPHMTPFDSQDLYALPVKRVPLGETRPEDSESDEKKDPPSEDTLPFGWEKHEDNDGPYYWHIKSGTITRTPPNSSTQVQSHAPLRAERRNKEEQMNVALSGTVTRSNTSSALSELSEARPRSKAVDNAYKRRSYPARSDLSDSAGSRPIRFAVRSLGWVEIAEEDLTPERSSKAVNRCIVDLSVGGRRDVLDVVGRWGDGKDLFMDLDEGSLKLVDPENLTVLNTQPIHTIRVWGVGRDNGRDFAYVARDRVTRKHMCHVFRCDTPARTIANTLRDICKKIMIERSLQQTISKPLDPGQIGNVSVGRVARPTNLPTEHRRLQRHSQVIPPQSFPTPMEEPKKVMRAQYVGAIEVTKPSGMDVLNAAIETMVESNPGPWKPVAVAVAPSTITITNTDDGRQLAECRVRFLSFLGIGQNVKQCAFIMHTAQDQFIAHTFYCEPSSGALCKTIEAACKLRYQKCLDAHPGGSGRGRGEATPRSLSATLRSVFTTFGGKKARSAES